MKIVTNIRVFPPIGGIYQTISSFVSYLHSSKQRNVSVVGVDIAQKGEGENRETKKKITSIFSSISSFCNFPPILEAMDQSSSLEDVQHLYKEVIEKYRQILVQEKPDIILLNGTYAMPWCLFLASRNLGIPIVLHYHGIVSKEAAHGDEKSRFLFGEMEKSFDTGNILYIFPSQLAKGVVEKEVYGHAIQTAYVLPNSIPAHFFDVKNSGNKQNLGMVGRWSKDKNSSFAHLIGKYNMQQENNFSINVITDLAKESSVYKRIARVVTFHDPMSNKNLANFYGEMGVFLSPSHFETYGNVAQEALASNTPTLINPNMGVSETFKKLGLHDWIIDFDSVDHVYDRAKEISRMGVSKKVRKMLSEEFSTHRIHSQLFSFIQSL